jgi:sRNA-binding regulator protein Hfq
MHGNTTEDHRSAQTQEGRRLSLPDRGPKTFRNPKSPMRRHVPRGHDAILADLQERRAEVAVLVMGTEGSYEGRIVGRDKFTITLQPTLRRAVPGESSTPEHKSFDKDEAPVTIYKHAIESFQATGRTVERPALMEVAA